MTTDFSELICGQANCPVSEDGKCLEGVIPPTSCPHLRRTSGVVETDELVPAPDRITLSEDQPQADSFVTDDVHIPYGEDLSLSDARRIMGHRLSRLIVVAGEAESGKTTLIASIYDRFLRGPFGGFDFAWSETLPGFERRSHHSRIASMRNLPETHPTKEMRLLHLRVRPTEDPDGFFQELLFADIPGEEFERIRDSEEAARKMEVIRRADRLLVLIDGAKLSDMPLAQRAKAQSETLLRRLLDTEMLGKRSIVDILFTKDDLIEIQTENEKVTSFIDETIRSCTAKFSARLGRLSFHRVAARPPHPVVLNYNKPLDELFKHWVLETMQFDAEPVNPYSPRGVSTGRQFDQFIERRLPQYIVEERNE